MRKLLLSTLFLLIVKCVDAQNFEGKIIYQLSYKSKVPSTTDAQLSAMAGTQHEYLIKGGNYKTIVSPSGAMMQWQMFLNKDNKLYNQYNKSETVFWNESRVNKDSVLSSQLNKNVDEINGYVCDELILTCKSGVQKYYFSSELKANPALFSNHQYGNWHYYLSKTKALPLKYIFEMPDMIVVSNATQVTPMSLDDSLFQLPANVKTAKSPF